MEAECQCSHNLSRQLNYLQQVLSHNKKPIGFLLGAGCPTAISHQTDPSRRLIPNVQCLTDLIVSTFSEHELKDSFTILNTHFVEDGAIKPNIEQMLSHIRLLEQVCGCSKVRGLSSVELRRLERAICNEICKVMKEKLPHKNTPYHQLAAWMSRQAELPIEIFTTNYDLLMEQSLEETGLPYFDGFVGSREPFFDTHAVEADILPARWARVWKLHGSINWFQDGPESPVVRRAGHIDAGSRVLIHPSHLKYEQSRKMPYLALLDRFKSFFKQPSAALIVCGYSFRDKHINEIIAQGLQGNSQTIVFAFLYGPIKQYKEAMDLASIRGNLSLLAEDEGVIGTRRGKWDKEGLEDSRAGVYMQEDDTKEVRFDLGNFEKLGGFLLEFINRDRYLHE